MAKSDICPRCAAFLNKMGTCLNCHPTGRSRPAGNPDHGNSNVSKQKRKKP